MLQLTPGLSATQWEWAWHWQMTNAKIYHEWPIYLSNQVFHMCTAYRMRRRNAYRSSSTSVTTSVTLTENSELSEPMDAYFGRATPSQLHQVVVIEEEEEEEHRPVPRPRHPIREFMHNSHCSSNTHCSNTHIIYDIRWMISAEWHVRCKAFSLKVTAACDADASA